MESSKVFNRLIKTRGISKFNSDRAFYIDLEANRASLKKVSGIEIHNRWGREIQTENTGTNLLKNKSKDVNGDER